MGRAGLEVGEAVAACLGLRPGGAGTAAVVRAPAGPPRESSGAGLRLLESPCYRTAPGARAYPSPRRSTAKPTKLRTPALAGEPGRQTTSNGSLSSSQSGISRNNRPTSWTGDQGVGLGDDAGPAQRRREQRLPTTCVQAATHLCEDRLGPQREPPGMIPSLTEAAHPRRARQPATLAASGRRVRCTRIEPDEPARGRPHGVAQARGREHLRVGAEAEHVRAGLPIDPIGMTATRHPSPSGAGSTSVAARTDGGTKAASILTPHGDSRTVALPWYRAASRRRVPAVQYAARLNPSGRSKPSSETANARMRETRNVRGPSPVPPTRYQAPPLRTSPRGSTVRSVSAFQLR